MGTHDRVRWLNYAAAMRRMARANRLPLSAMPLIHAAILAYIGQACGGQFRIARGDTSPCFITCASGRTLYRGTHTACVRMINQMNFVINPHGRNTK